MASDEPPKTPTEKAVDSAKALLDLSDAVAYIIIALPEDGDLGDVARIKGDVELLAPMSLRLQFIMYKMIEATTVQDVKFQVVGAKPEEKKKEIEGYR